MADNFPIIEIPQDAVDETEEMGTKEKFWFHHEKFGKCLYKKARENTGEDWSEKIAANLSDLLGLPHANYELATFLGQNGIISPSFLPDKGSNITHGNEILARTVPNYQKYSKKPSQHTISSVLNAIADKSVNLPIGWTPPKGINTAVDTFVGYLLLDAWIGNTDRHHENWAFINLAGKTYLSPTYDCASCLGRNEPDEKRKKRLITKDDGFSVKAYINKSSSAFYAQVGDRKTLKTFDVFDKAAQRYPNAAKIWLKYLEEISTTDDVVLQLFQRIPKERISEPAINFAQKILELNQHRLLKLRDKL